MNAFKTMIGGNTEDVKNIRVNNFSNTALSESKIMIENLKNEYRNKQNEIECALDLGPNTADDLANLKNVNSRELFTKMYAAADALSIIARKIKIRVAIHNTLFPEDKVEDLSAEELDFLKGCL